MLWIGALFGVFFGWAGILVAALFWATLAIFKLLWALTLFAFQVLLAVGALLARALIWLFHWVSQRMAAKSPAPRTRGTTISTRKTKATPAGLKPKRKKAGTPSGPDA
jgi:hypothetical protein